MTPRFQSEEDQMARMPEDENRIETVLRLRAALRWASETFRMMGSEECARQCEKEALK